MLTLTEAAARLGLRPSTLLTQVQRGRLRATKFGPVWTVEEVEVERYRAESLGRIGRHAESPKSSA